MRRWITYERRCFLKDRLNILPAQFRKWGSSGLLCRVIAAGALAWIEQREPPDPDTLCIPDDDFGLIILQALEEQSLLG